MHALSRVLKEGRYIQGTALIRPSCMPLISSSLHLAEHHCSRAPDGSEVSQKPGTPEIARLCRECREGAYLAVHSASEG